MKIDRLQRKVKASYEILLNPPTRHGPCRRHKERFLSRWWCRSLREASPPTHAVHLVTGWLGSGAHCDWQIKHFFCKCVVGKGRKRRNPGTGTVLWSSLRASQVPVPHPQASRQRLCTCPPNPCKVLPDICSPSVPPINLTFFYFSMVSSTSGGQEGLGVHQWFSNRGYFALHLRGHLVMSGDIFREVLLASSGERSRMLLKILQGTG